MLCSTGLLLVFLAFASADTPASCSYEEMKGTWIFSETSRDKDGDVDCMSNRTERVERQFKITLEQFDKAIDEYGNVGTWTIISTQGFEATVNERTYFTFLKWEETSEGVISICDETQYGWSHDVTVRNWACFSGVKEEKVTPKVNKKRQASSTVYRANEKFINQINSAQKSWKAKHYDMFEGKTYEDIIRMQGGRISGDTSPPKMESMKTRTKATAPLPAAFDWRDVDGVDYVTPVRDQADCGSCYIFSSTGMIGSRIRILTNNTEQPILSPQEILSCSVYSQGCSGGFSYLVAGKYAKDHGLVEEECIPYEAKDTECKETQCKRYYVSRYHYVGGFYGAGNEENMKQALVESGPIVVGFYVYDDFRSYSEGVYHHTGLEDEYNPIEPTNHSVMVVGYGTEEETGEDYWIVMNSWGEEWGDKGYFKIRRGVDECAIESKPFEAFPIP